VCAAKLTNLQVNGVGSVGVGCIRTALSLVSVHILPHTWHNVAVVRNVRLVTKESQGFEAWALAVIYTVSIKNVPVNFLQ